MDVLEACIGRFTSKKSREGGILTFQGIGGTGLFARVFKVAQKEQTENSAFVADEIKSLFVTLGQFYD